MRAKFPRCRSIDILEEDAATYTFYLVLDFPKPLRDRDATVGVILRQA